MTKPALFVWDGSVMVPNPPSLALCINQFEKGVLYRLTAEEERSLVSHRHYMAVIAEAYNNLPHQYDGMFRSPNHLRYWCLIVRGFCDEKIVILDTPADAQKFADYVIGQGDNMHAQISGPIVKIWTAHSQRFSREGGMDKETFQASKDAVFDQLADMLGISTAQLTENAGRAA